MSQMFLIFDKKEYLKVPEYEKTLNQTCCVKCKNGNLNTELLRVI